jgi:hypothetical protein
MPRPPGADAARAGVEQGDQAVLLAGREDRPVRRVVGFEGLQGRVELDPAQAEPGDVGDLGDGLGALVRVDRPEAGERVRILLAGPGDGLVGNAWPVRRRLRVPGQQDRLDAEGGVAIGELVQRLALGR